MVKHFVRLDHLKYATSEALFETLTFTSTADKHCGKIPQNERTKMKTLYYIRR